MERKNTLLQQGSIKWSNIHDCPEGYQFNEEGYIITNEPHPLMKVNTLFYLLKRISSYQLVLQNAIVFLRLNPDEPLPVLKHALNKRFFTPLLKSQVDNETFNSAWCKAVEMYDQPEYYPPFNEGIVVDKVVWYSKDCEIQHVSKLRAHENNRHIERVRTMMSINTKWKTEHVKKAADASEYGVKKYWKSINVSAKDRRNLEIQEAIDQLHNEGVENPTQQKIADVAGVTKRTVYNYFNE